MDILGGNTVLTVVLFFNMFLLGVVVTAAYLHWRRHLKSGGAQSTTSNLPDKIQEKILVQAQDNYEKVLQQSAAVFSKDLNTTTAHLNQELEALTGDLVRKEVERYKATLSQLQDSATQKFGETGAGIDAHTAELETKLAERLKAMDEILTEHQQQLESQLTEQTHELDQEFQQIRASYAQKQVALEAELAEKESVLMSELKQRETTLASHQAELAQDLVGRQQLFVTKQSELEQKLEAEMAKRRESYQAAIDTKLSDAVVSFLSDTLGQQVDLGAQTPYLLQQLEAHKEELKQELAP